MDLRAKPEAEAARGVLPTVVENIRSCERLS